MDEHGFHSRTNVTTLSMEKRTKSKATPMREREASAKGLVKQIFSLLISWEWNLGSYFELLTSCHICRAFFIPELLSLQSAKENDFAINYSPKVWKGTMNVWLGMYFDTNSEYHVTRGREEG